MSLRTGKPAATVRSHVLAIVLVGALLPLGAVGLWLNASAIDAGESLMQGHLDESADNFVSAVQRRWIYRSADVSLLTGNEITRRVVYLGTARAADSQYLSQLAAQLESTIPAFELRGLRGEAYWSTDQASRDRASGRSGSVGTLQRPGRAIIMSFSIADSAGARIGDARVEIALSALLPSDSARSFVPGASFAVRDASTGSVLTPLASGAPFPSKQVVMIGGDVWRSAIRRMVNPPLEIAVAAPRSKYVLPFERNARIGLFALVAVTLLAMVLTFALTVRVTRPLERLALAADEVSRGRLEHTVAESGPAEVQRLGGSFNAMTQSLRETLETLSRQNAMAAVGAFATSLSHDVRNALTSIKVDLQRAVRRRGTDGQTQALVERSLNTVTRLEAAVTGALRVARGARMAAGNVDLYQAIRAAGAMVEGAFAAVPARLDLEFPPEPAWVRGDSSALEQLFANLLFNSAQALGPGGVAIVRVESVESDLHVIVRDNGAGMDAANIRALEQPFHSSKHDGTGLGLPIARQIAAAHGGGLEIASTLGGGTTISVRIPLAPRG